MAYTNKTINYELPQYIGTDKPSYLNDFNYAMSTIDAQMKTNANSASSADSNATQALNTANSANGKIGNLQDLETTNKTTVVDAINEIVPKKWNIKKYAQSELTINGGSIGDYTEGGINLAYTDDMKEFKLYGAFTTTASSNSNCEVLIPLPTGFTDNVEEDYVITPAVFTCNTSITSGINNWRSIYIDKAQNRARLRYSGTTTKQYWLLMPYLYQNQNFFDVDSQ